MHTIKGDAADTFLALGRENRWDYIFIALSDRRRKLPVVGACFVLYFFGMGSSECHEFERDFCSLIMSPRFTDAFYWPAFKVGACWH